MNMIEFLVKNNYITQDEMNEALVLQKYNKGLDIGEILIKMKVITKGQLIKYAREYDKKARRKRMAK